MFKIANSIPHKWFKGKTVKEEKNYEYIFREIIKRVNVGKEPSKRNRTKRQLSGSCPDY